MHLKNKMHQISTYMLLTISVIFGRSAFSQEATNIPDLVDFMFAKNGEELLAYEHSIGSKPILEPFTQQLFELEFDSIEVAQYQAEGWKDNYFFLRPFFGNLFHVVYYRWSYGNFVCEHYWFLSNEQFACVYSLAISFESGLNLCWQTIPDSTYLKNTFENPPLANVEELFAAYESIRDGYSQYLGSEPLKCHRLSQKTFETIHNEFVETGKFDFFAPYSPFLNEPENVHGGCIWGKSPERSKLTIEYQCADKQFSSTILIRLAKGY